jgi:hypothetical protein
MVYDVLAVLLIQIRLLDDDRQQTFVFSETQQFLVRTVV